MALRRRLLDERRGEVLAALPGSEAACREVLVQLAGFLPQRFPERFERDGDVLTNRATGERWDLEAPDLEPLDIAGRLVQEDFCILQMIDGELCLTAAVMCFINRWRLADKLGRPTAAIHGPVALYAERLEKPVDRFLSALAPDRPVWRLNWGLTADAARFQPVELLPDPPITAEDAGQRVYLRVERQTVRRLPRTGAVLFGIRTYQRPLGILPAADAARLAAAIRALPEPMARYKGLLPIQGAVLGWLDRVAT
jgi:hypothetical protein